MKRLIVILVAAAISLSVVSQASAIERKYGTAGCGLGSMLLGDEPGMVQILAVILNNIAGNQTFGITSGTLNCEKKANFANNEKLDKFVVANLDSLARDIAAGHGESLETMVELIGVSPEQRMDAYAKLQTNFSNIFTYENIEAAEVINNVIAVLNV